MKLGVFFLLFVFGYIQCRKTYAPIDKNANLAFINMEGGGAPKPGSNVSPTNPAQPAPSPVKPAQPAPLPVKPGQPAPLPVKPTQPAPAPVKPAPSPVKPAQPAPAPYPAKGPGLVTTPGPGSVKQLINYYDSQGKHSVIRPYSYSEAVKQG